MVAQVEKNTLFWIVRTKSGFSFSFSIVETHATQLVIFQTIYSESSRGFDNESSAQYFLCMCVFVYLSPKAEKRRKEDYNQVLYKKDYYTAVRLILYTTTEVHVMYTVQLNKRNW